MTKEQKAKVNELRNQGLGYSAIAEMLGISKSTISSFCKVQENEIRCPICNSPIRNKKGFKPRIYCSDRCRMQFWKVNKEKIVRKPDGVFICKYCQKEFTGYKSKSPKFCSLDCYFHFRYGDKHEAK